MTVKNTYPWASERRYNAYSNYCIRTYGGKLQKIPLDAGYSCPNRDGSIGSGGCSFCNNEAFTPFYCDPSKSITEQMQEGIAYHQKTERKPRKYVAYFQAYTNTHGSTAQLRKNIDEALSLPDVAGFTIGTRPDCMDEEKFDLLASYVESYIVSLDLGIESCYDETLERINRGHGFEKVTEVCQDASLRGINSCGHLIFGLPGESRDMMLFEAEILSNIPIDSLKFHQLQILKNTQIAKDYIEKPEDFLLFGAEEYCDFIVDFLERLAPHIVIERLCSEVPHKYLLFSGWNKLKAHQVTSMIEKKLDKRNSWQGKLYGKDTKFKVEKTL